MQNNINSSYSLSKNQQFQRNKLKKNNKTMFHSNNIKKDEDMSNNSVAIPKNQHTGKLVADQWQKNQSGQQSLHFSAQKSNVPPSSDEKYQKTLHHQVKEWATVIIIAFLIHLVVRTLVIEIFEIPSSSMVETLLIGDNVAVTKYSYGYGPYSSLIDLPISKRIFSQQPERGDVIVFQSTTNNGKKYIKRLIGLPGDMIRVKDGVLEINGDEIPRVKNENQYTFIDENGNRRIYDRYTETLPNGVSYTVLGDIRADVGAFPDSTSFYNVPEGHYFFMGDNRNNSIDSRFLHDIGYVPEINLVGKARSVVWNKKAIIENIAKNWHMLLIAGVLAASMVVAWRKYRAMK